MIARQTKEGKAFDYDNPILWVIYLRYKAAAGDPSEMYDGGAELAPTCSHAPLTPKWWLRGEAEICDVMPPRNSTLEGRFCWEYKACLKHIPYVAAGYYWESRRVPVKQFHPT